jgi:ABC-type glycerol-3-phosphate transport system substrate-binding protein
MRGMRTGATVMLVVALASCGPGNKEPERGVTLTLYHWMGKDRALWEQNIITPFEEAHPGIRVVLQTSPYTLYVSKTLTSIASGSRVADLMFAEDWFGQELIRKHYAVNLMPYIRRDLRMDDFYRDAFVEWRGTTQRDDELFGFPTSLGFTVLFYNKDLFDKAGVPYPDTTWTYDDLVRVGKQLTVDSDNDGVPEQWGLSFDVHYTGLETLVYSFGGRTLTADRTHAVLTEPPTIRAFQFVQDIFLKHRIASNATSFISPWEAFVGQRAAMNLIGSHGSMNLEGSGIRWDMTFPPKGPGGERWSRRYSMAFLIPRTSPHPDEAWELLCWILTKSPVGQLDRQYLGMMPTYRPFTDSSAWLQAEPRYNRYVLVALARSQSFPLFTPAWQEWRDNNLTPEMVTMIQGKKSVAEFARDAERRINGVLARVLQE